MKMLFAIQGTGNGHLARAEDVIPVLQKYGELDLFVSGSQVDIKLPYPVKYRSRGLSFYFGKRGGINMIKTFRKNSSRDVFREIASFPVEKYDLVINDFEAITAWACRRKKVPCISLSHQSALLSEKVPRPRHYDPVGWWLLKYYAPTMAHVGFHFRRYDDWIFTPVIRNAVRETKSVDKGHYTVYLPAYGDRNLVPLLAKIPGIRWHMFSKHTHEPYHIGGISVYPVNKVEFAASMASARGVLCGAGFETPAEALHLGKKLLVVPMQGQYEQHFNATAIRELGVSVVKKMSVKYLTPIRDWVDSNTRVTVQYDDIREEAVARALEMARDLKVPDDE